MDSSVTNIATMGPEQIKNFHQTLLNNAFTQRLEQNKRQIETLNDYKKRHEKVIEGLQVYPLSVSENCMVPIGKRALMKGKLIHTNEILVCLGDGYFAKYSAPQAISVCNRRIAWADTMLKSLEAERNLYETRQILPLQYDLFGDGDRKDLLEHWDEDKLDDWRVLHRQREKEYHQKLAKLREQEKTEIRTEEDLLKRLDELELEEELEDEIYRLEAEQKKFYNDDLQEGEVYDESEEDDSSDCDEITAEKIEEELKKLKNIQMNKYIKNTSNVCSEVTQDTTLDKNEQSSLAAHSSQDKLKENYLSELGDVSEDTSLKKRRVSFVEPCAMENDTKEEIPISQKSCSVLKQNCTHNEDSKEEDDIIQIEFSHSSCAPNIPESNNVEIQSPTDIYKMFCAPKSILKRSPNDMIPNQIAPPLDEDSNTETEDEDDHVKPSAYNSVIKEVQESKVSTMNTLEKDKKKIVSRFKLERAARKK
nr:PREDICTED: RNA polymerase II subunit 5-mediating protein homolog [Linepithema humile]